MVLPRLQRLQTHRHTESKIEMSHSNKYSAESKLGQGRREVMVSSVCVGGVLVGELDAQRRSPRGQGGVTFKLEF